MRPLTDLLRASLNSREGASRVQSEGRRFDPAAGTQLLLSYLLSSPHSG